MSCLNGQIPRRLGRPPASKATAMREILCLDLIAQAATRAHPSHSKLIGRLRRAAIGRLVQHRHGGLPDTDDSVIYLAAVAHFEGSTDHRAFVLDAWCRRNRAPPALLARVDAIVAEAPPEKLTAARLGAVLRLKDRERTACKISTIAPVDMTKQQRAARRKASDRERKRAARAAAGAKPRAESLSRTKPWTALGISRRTWERRRRDANSSAISLSITTDGFASTVPQAAREGLRLGTGPGEHPQKPTSLQHSKQRMFWGGTPDPWLTRTTSRAASALTASCDDFASRSPLGPAIPPDALAIAADMGGLPRRLAAKLWTRFYWHALPRWRQCGVARWRLEWRDAIETEAKDVARYFKRRAVTLAAIKQARKTNAEHKRRRDAVVTTRRCWMFYGPQARHPDQVDIERHRKEKQRIARAASRA
jgi:hypothetical protein